VFPKRHLWNWQSTSVGSECRLTALQVSALALSVPLAALVPFLLFPLALVLLAMLARLLLLAALLFLAVLALPLFLLILLPIFPSVVIAHSNLLG